MKLIFSNFFKKYLSRKIDKPNTVPCNFAVYRPFDESIDPDCVANFLAVVKHKDLGAREYREKSSECETCGACCAFFIVAFPNAELDIVTGGVVPNCMTLSLNDSKSFMKGTGSKSHRCIALEGMVGYNVKCTIYKNRPSSCRNFIKSWEIDTGNELCDKARLAYGLQSFSKY